MRKIFQGGFKMKTNKKIAWQVNENDCWICTSHAGNGHGYPQYQVNGKPGYLSRYMYENKHSKIPDGMCACHKCDTPMCINPDHIFLGTRADNNADKVSKNRQACEIGELNSNSKLTEKQIIEIRNIHDMKHRQIAEIYNVSKSHITNIRRNYNWRHLLGSAAK